MKKVIKQILSKRIKEKFLKEREINNFIQLKNDWKIIKEREALFKSKNLNLNKIERKVVVDMVEKGFSSKRLYEVYDNSNELMNYLKELCEEVKELSLKELLERYGEDETKKYWFNIYQPKNNTSDPIKKFITNPKLIKIASTYLGEIPKVAFLSVLYTPKTKENSKNSMMWHLDNISDSMFRMFINPYDMTIEHGATMIFPNKYQPKYDYYKKFPYFTDDEAKEFGFDFDDKVDLVGDAGQIYFADSANCFHCGSRSKKDRFVAILTFVPYLHSNKYDDTLMKDEFSLYKKENEIILNYFKEDNN